MRLGAGAGHLYAALMFVCGVSGVCAAQNAGTETGATEGIIQSESERIRGRVEALGGWRAWDDSLAGWRQAIDAMPLEGKGRGGIEATLFHVGSVGFLQRGLSLKSPGDSPVQPWEAGGVKAAREFSLQLAERGIGLVVVPVPCALSIYPERSGATPPAEVGVQYLHLVSELLANGVDTIDLYSPFLENRFDGEETLYYRTDHHWNSRGILLSASLIAERLARFKLITEARTHPPLYTRKELRLEDWRGALSPEADMEKYPSENIERSQILNQDGTLYAEPKSAPVLLLGDSFVQYVQFKGTATEIGANLAYELNCPVQTISNYGLTAAQMPRLVARKGPDFLNNRVVVVWIMFDISFHDPAALPEVR